MLSVSSFSCFVAVLLLFGTVQCEKVGHGRHELVGEKIENLKGNTRIAESDADLLPYMGLDGACNVTMDEKDGNILKSNDFETLKNIPFYGTKEDCPQYNIKCKTVCLKTGDYSIGWVKGDVNVDSSLQLIGDQNILRLKSKESTPNWSLTTLTLRGSKFELNYKTARLPPICFKEENKRKPKEWKIVDTKYKETDFKSLFTFHILPINALRKRMKDIVCEDHYKEKECDGDSDMQKCEKIYMKFEKEKFKVLVPDTSTTKSQTSTTQTVILTTNLNKKSTSNLNKKSTTSRSKITKTTEYSPITSETLNTTQTTKTSTKKRTFMIIVIIVIITLLCSTCFGLLICFFVLRGKNKKENKQKTKEVNKSKKPVSPQVSTPNPSPRHLIKPDSLKIKQTKKQKMTVVSRPNKLPVRDSKEEGVKSKIDKPVDPTTITKTDSPSTEDHTNNQTLTNQTVLWTYKEPKDVDKHGGDETNEKKMMKKKKKK
uniref:Uncharacterized protein n=1 Tax=Meloidogyne hapla TaxID=6305 RepID=A0A1I8C1J9_MELHA